MPKPSTVRTPINVASPGSPKTTSSVSHGRCARRIDRAHVRGSTVPCHAGREICRRRGVPRRWPAGHLRGSHVRSEPVSTRASSGKVICPPFFGLQATILTLIYCSPKPTARTARAFLIPLQRINRRLHLVKMLFAGYPISSRGQSCRPARSKSSRGSTNLCPPIRVP